MFLKTIYLIGPMGAGKSTIGRLLSQKMELPFIDTDREIEQRSGVSVSWIFDMEGEKGFRQRETALLKELSSAEGMIIATGGGTIIEEENQRLIRSNGFIVFLETAIETQVERTCKDKRRPLLQNGVDRYKVLSEIYKKREGLYRSLADLTVNTDAGTPFVVIRNIIDEYNRQ